MKELIGDLWEFHGVAIICITTNGYVTGKGEAVFGRGCARQSQLRFPGIRLRLGNMLATVGNHVHWLGDGVVSFPVEESPWSNPDLRLIRRSAEELRKMADIEGWDHVVVPRPGCGGGGLMWEEVRPLLLEVFDDRFTVISACP